MSTEATRVAAVREIVRDIADMGDPTESGWTRRATQSIAEIIAIHFPDAGPGGGRTTVPIKHVCAAWMVEWIDARSKVMRRHLSTTLADAEWEARRRSSVVVPLYRAEPRIDNDGPNIEAPEVKNG